MGHLFDILIERLRPRGTMRDTKTKKQAKKRHPPMTVNVSQMQYLCGF